jgi:hypothetical protein
LKKFLLIGTVFFCAFQARTADLAFIALNTASWGQGRLPSDWQIKVHHGHPDISPCTDSKVACLHLKSDKSSFGLEHSVDVDPGQYPFLTWNWKVSRLPSGADFRKSSTDDQAAQVLVAFDDHRVLSYIWDSSAPKGAEQKTSYLAMVHVYATVCESGASSANQWISETRNVAADYVHAFGKPAPHVKGLRIQINSQHTGTVAESYFGDVAFRSALP